MDGRLRARRSRPPTPPTGAAVELGRGVHDGAVVTEARRCKVPLRDDQPARPDRRRDRHRQDQDAAGDRRAAVGRRRPGRSSPTSRATCPASPSPGDRPSAAAKRAADLGVAVRGPTGFPVEYLALGGIGPGVPVRATVSDFGPQLLAKVLGANETQEQRLGLVFHYADAKGLPLLDLVRPARAAHASSTPTRARPSSTGIGGLSSATVGVLLRALVGLEDGRRQRVLRRAAVRHRATCCAPRPTAAASSRCLELPAVQDKPKLFSTVLMWLLAELFEELPEVGDLDKPKLVVLLRRGAPALRRREQGVPRARSRRPCG